MENTREKKGKKFLLMFFMLVLSLVLAACNEDGEKGTDDAKNEEKTKELNLVIPSEPPSLHPQLATDTTSGAILMNVFEGLTTLKDGEVENAAAEDVKISDDQLTYTFTLRDAKWSNGDVVTADDFAYAWEFALNPKNASEYATILYPIKGAEAYNTGKGTELGIKVLDEKTLEVTLENPTPYFFRVNSI